MSSDGKTVHVVYEDCSHAETKRTVDAGETVDEFLQRLHPLDKEDDCLVLRTLIDAATGRELASGDAPPGKVTVRQESIDELVDAEDMIPDLVDASREYKLQTSTELKIQALLRPFRHLDKTGARFSKKIPDDLVDKAMTVLADAGICLDESTRSSSHLMDQRFYVRRWLQLLFHANRHNVYTHFLERRARDSKDHKKASKHFEKRRQELLHAAIRLRA